MHVVCQYYVLRRGTPSSDWYSILPATRLKATFTLLFTGAKLLRIIDDMFILQKKESMDKTKTVFFAIDFWSMGLPNIFDCNVKYTR